MFKITLTTVLMLIFAASLAFADEILIKKSFFSGWKYSLDGENYETVGFSGKSLKEFMKGNDAAQGEMEHYKTSNIMAVTVLIPCVALGTYSIIEDFDSDDKKTDIGIRLIIIGLCVVGLIFDHSASEHLKKAVEIYNDDKASLGLNINFFNPKANDRGSIITSLQINF